MEESEITHVLPYDNYNWEPQFVGDSRVPFHDERWPYGYRDNAHLSLHLCFMNFTFSVVSDVFSIHKGIRVRGNSRHLDQMELIQELQPWLLKKRYNSELEERYPGMREQCFAD